MKKYTVIFRESFFDGKTSKNTFKKTKHFKLKKNAYKFAETMQESAKDQFSWDIIEIDSDYQNKGYDFSSIIDSRESKYF